jgi:uncharacterized protein YdeI (YjbR/CyaY-like superfamily)
MKPIFFKTPDAFRTWMDENHETKLEVLVGFYKVGRGKPTLTWPESVDVALCFGWIDGVRGSINENSYQIRFTPRKKSSIWSNVNIEKVHNLMKRGLMHPAGLKAFEIRKETKSGIYSYEQKKDAELPEDYEKKFKANRKAWEFFQKQPPWYRRTSFHRIVSAKQEPTRIKRLLKLIEDSANGIGAPKR